MMSNEWFENKKLPPVDIKCMQGNHIVQIVAHIFNGENEYAVFQHIDGNGCGYSHYDSFRPIKSEREKAIEEMVKVLIRGNGSTFGDCAKNLYDAGYRKLEDK